MRYALRSSILGLALAAWPAYGQSPETSLFRTSFVGPESEVASVFGGVSFGRAASARHPVRFRADWFGQPCFVMYGHVSEERWAFGPRMGFVDVVTRRALDGEWAYMGWCPRDAWWAYIAWDVVTSIWADERRPPDVWLPRRAEPRVVFKEPSAGIRHARPRPTTVDPGPIVPPPVTPVAPVRPRSVPPRRSERRTGSRGWSVLGSVLDGLGRAVLSDVGRALLPDLGRSSQPDESRAERRTSRSAHPRGRSATHRSSPPERSSRPPKGAHRRSGGDGSRR